MSRLRTFLQTGSVGLMYSIRLTRTDRRLQRLTRHVAAEKAVHCEHLALLNAEIDSLVEQQLRLNVAAGQFFAAFAQASTGSRP